MPPHQPGAAGARATSAGEGVGRAAGGGGGTLSLSFCEHAATRTPEPFVAKVVAAARAVGAGRTIARARAHPGPSAVGGANADGAVLRRFLAKLTNHYSRGP